MTARTPINGQCYEALIMPSRPYPAWQRRHEAVLLYLLQRPAAKLDEVADATGYTRWQISRIINGPDFHQRYRAALADAEGRLAEQVISTPGSLRNQLGRTLGVIR
jgi:hypothetical protein